jgi:hypothetical protein
MRGPYVRHTNFRVWFGTGLRPAPLGLTPVQFPYALGPLHSHTRKCIWHMALSEPTGDKLRCRNVYLLDIVVPGNGDRPHQNPRVCCRCFPFRSGRMQVERLVKSIYDFVTTSETGINITSALTAYEPRSHRMHIVSFAFKGF